MFPELLPHLRDAFEVAPDRSEYVINRHRGTNANLRTQLLRILDRAQVEPWERVFHNLRASRQTELEMKFPSHVVCDWLGNSEAVARDHYLQTIEGHFAEATKATQKATHCPSIPAPTAPHAQQKTPGNPGLSVPVCYCTDVQAPPRGVEPLLPD